jgi:hypothetical protein
VVKFCSTNYICSPHLTNITNGYSFVNLFACTCPNAAHEIHSPAPVAMIHCYHMSTDGSSPSRRQLAAGLRVFSRVAIGSAVCTGHRFQTNPDHKRWKHKIIQLMALHAFRSLPKITLILIPSTYESLNTCKHRYSILLRHK